MGRHHVRVVRELTGVTLAAVADPAGDRFGAARDCDVLPDVADLIRAGIDAAIVAIPTAEHEAVALALAQAGVHTMVEKPIADTAVAGERIATAFEQAGLVGVVGYVERCNPAMVELRHRLLDGQLGEIYQITTSRQSPFPSRVADVGVVQDLATHDIDLTAWIAGSEYVSISAQTAHRSGRQFEDMVVASGRLANGIIVNHLVNWLSPRKERQTVVTGERGALVADTLTGDVTFYENGTVETEWEAVAVFRGVSEGNAIRYAIPKREPLLVEAEGFRDAILCKPSESVPMRAAVRTVQVVEAILESAKSGNVVRF